MDVCSRDTANTEVHLQVGGENIGLRFTSVYLPYDSTETLLSLKLMRIVEFSNERKRQLILRCDANTHHTLWGSTGVKNRGECLLNCIPESGLVILNQGNKPTSKQRRSQGLRE